MKKSKLEAIRSMVAQEIASGASQRQLAVRLGISPSAVCRFVQKDDVQQLIEREKLNFIQALPNAVDNIVALVAGFRYLPPDDVKGREMAFRATKLVLEAFGLLSPENPAPATLNYLNKDEQKLFIGIDLERI
jgi:DNA-binding Lrp family transcriptional regulator